MRPVSPIKVDTLLAKPKSGTKPVAQTLAGQCDFTRATVSGNRLTVYTGSHWRIEFSGGQWSTTNWSQYQIYSVTDGDYVGIQAIGGGPTYSVKGRVCATALILNSDISTSKELEFRFVAGSGNVARTDSAYASFQYLPVKIFELPVV